MGDSELWLSFTSPDPSRVGPRPGDPVSADLTRDAGLCEISGEVWESGLEGSLVIRVTEVNRLQRRRFVRVRVHFGTVVGTLLDAADQPIEIMPVRIVDLSGGGISFEAESPLNHDDRLRVPIPLGEGAPVDAVVTVVDIAEEIEPNERGEYEIAYGTRAVFSKISEADRRRVIHFVFRAQAEARSRVAR